MSFDGTAPLPSLEDIEAMARGAFAELPGEFRALTGDIVFAVHDFPDAETIARMDLRSGYELLGLFHGAPLSAHLANRAGPMPTMIFLYRLPILNFWRHNASTLPDIVRNVLIHEIGHHFGFSDADMERIEAAAD
jgi:predicted Zn-dependent protease with MMP-like domain